ncbi:hypothetical protein SDJN02_16960, partial [Cucurbita argyrosperma subsp. argyrosperma]
MGSDMGLCYEIQRWNIFYKGNKGKTGPCAAAAAAAAASSRTIQSCRLVDDAIPLSTLYQSGGPIPLLSLVAAYP